MPEVNLLPFFEFYKGEPHEKEAIQLLQQAMPDSLLKNDSSWVAHYRTKPDQAVPDLNAPFDTQLTEHFTMGELCNQEEARRFTSSDQLEIAIELCEFLEKARAKFGPIRITSGNRPPAINAAVGGASNSEHLFKQGCGAVDCYPINGDGAEFEAWVDQNWAFSVGHGMSYRGFCHIGIRAGRPRVRWDY